jgi:hypothetical protein
METQLGVPVDASPQVGAPVCASMPSATAARDFMLGVSGSIPHLLFSYAGRAAIVAMGMYVAGKRNHLARDAAVGAAVIELALLAYFGFEKNQHTDRLPTQYNVAQFLQGKPQYLVPMTADVLTRTLEIMGGLTLIGSTDHRIRDALAGSLAVELFILTYSVMFGEPCQP